MCGIAGFLGRDRSVDGAHHIEVVRRMTDAIAHRGPDADGVWTSGPCVLGHRRLSILDLSPDGRQPLLNEDERIGVVVNGEIYNFEALRNELIEKGHRFRSRSDSEVVVHLYEEYGSGCVERLDGMFAFALWDSRNQKLLLARDRSGKKPLVYRITSRGLLFASEVQALARALPDERPEVDLAAVDEYLTLQYVPAPYTVWKDTKKLPAAHWAMVSPGETIEPKRYWTVRRSIVRTEPVEVLAKELRGLLTHAVKQRMVADVSLGAFLSGGVDSSAVVALMSSLSAQPIQTFSIGFPNADDSELHYARMVARRFGTDHRELVVSPDMTSLVGEIAHHHGEPFADSSSVAMWCLSKMTRQHVTVALSGDGSDEVFAGYKRYNPARLGHLYDGLPGVAKTVFQSVFGSIAARANAHIGRFAHALHEGEAARYLHLVGQFNAVEKRALYAPAMQAAMTQRTLQRFETILAESEGRFAMARLLDVDFATYLTDDIHAKVDIATMAHALEVRCPFLDTAVVEFAATLPMNALMRGRGKHILRVAMNDLVPGAILWRAKKGFALPLERWMREDLREMTRDLLLSQRATQRGIFDPKEVSRLLARAERERTDADRLWTLLMLEAWFRAFVDA
jgi:asparagine synthase (glutamine-hydrolysing)